ncbi:MAG: DUF2190 family protein [Methyloprofundus sp.]|nr:DUF2190 family protein [Methyloprofundus sp.]
MYSNKALCKAFLATTAILPHMIVKFGAADNTVSTAIAATDLLIGVSDELGISALDVTEGATVDVVLSGIAEVKLAGTVVRGAKLTSNASGQAVTAVATNQVLGVAMMSGVAGDVVPVLLNQSTF